jgi:DNA-binding SARP family transcriptional activator
VPLRLTLLGRPSITRDGVPVRLGGRQTWGLLAYLLLTSPAPSRRDVMGRLITEAADPQAAFRWVLHQVRRALLPEVEIVDGGGRLTIVIGQDVEVDILTLLDQPTDVAAIESLAAGELLEGMAFDNAPAFEFWLATQRTHLVHVAAEAVWWAATRLATSDPGRALRVVQLGLRLDPYCETKNELAVDLHLQMGNVEQATRHVEAATRLFRDELGLPLPETIRRPLERRHRPQLASVVPSARALLHSARARFAAGDHDRALDAARRAADESLAVGDAGLELASLVLLATVLIHSHRGRGDEAKGLLTRAAQLANGLGDGAALVDIERELGFVLTMQANYGAAEALLSRSAEAARRIGDVARSAMADTYIGICRSDRGDLPGADAILRDAIEQFRRAGELGWQGYAEGTQARVRRLIGDLAQAADLASQGIDHVREAGWTAMLPWPMIVAADAALATGDFAGAQDGFTEALTLGVEIGDPCWESLSLRGLALVRAADGDVPGAIGLLEDGLRRCRRFDDVYAWARAVILTDLVVLEDGTDPVHLADAGEIAHYGPMPDLIERLTPWRRSVRPQTRLQTVSF